MAIETYVNGSKNGCITFINDHEPCSVYVDGEKQTNISYRGESIQGSPSLEYASEYKKNLISMAVDGNTVQNGTPTPELPQPIQNAGDNGLECVLRGKNLLNVDKFVELVKKYHVYAYETTVDGRKCIAFMNNQMHERDFTSCCPVFKEKTRYIFSFEARPQTVFSETEQYNGGLIMGFKPSGITPNKQLSAKTTTEFTRMYNINYTNTTIRDINISYGSAAMWLIDLDSIYLYEYEGDTDPEYEPYFIEKIQIPSEVTLKDGAVVKLRLGKYEESADKIVVDKGVTYKKALGYLRLSSSQKFKVYIYETSYLGIQLDNCLEQRLKRARGTCSHSTKVGYYWTGPNLIWLGVNKSTNLYWVGILDLLGIVDSWADKWNPTTEEKEIAIEKFKEWLDEQEASGTPVEILYQLNDIVEYDLTETELGKQLLSFTESTQNQTNIIEVTPSNIDNPNVSNISITYAKWGGKTNEN